MAAAAALAAAGCATVLAAGSGARPPSSDAAAIRLPVVGRAHVSLDAMEAPVPVVVGGPGVTPRAAPAVSAPPRQLIVPDIIAVLPSGVSKARLAAIRGLSGVRAVLAVDGGQVRVNGKAAGVLGASEGALRSWTPPETAASSAVWTDFSRGDLVSSAGAARSLGLKQGYAYSVTAAVRAQVRFGTTALLGVPGIDAVVDSGRAAQLGLVRNVGVLINAPGSQLDNLVTRVRAILGSGGQVVRLVPVTAPTSLPVNDRVPSGRPTSYLMLYQESAAEYCPGLSWTVLAAIGEIESDNGANMGPSSAGALGPMQFMPGTWAIWGIDAFGETGPPDIMDPLDAVPSAARMLCADGAADGPASLSAAIFDYNHADWYVSEVLELAGEYAHEFG